MAEAAVKDIKVEITEIQPCVKKLSIEIPESAVAQKSENALKDVRKNARIQGFRKGHVPKEILKKMYGKSVLHDVGRQLINDGMDRVLTENEISVFGQPAIEDIEIEEGKPISFTAMVETMPQITLAPYTEWSFTREIRKVSDKEIEAFIDHIREMKGEMVPAENRPIKKDDYVFLDFTGTMDGKEVESLTGKNQHLVIKDDEKALLADFNRKLIGMKKDEESEFTVKLPKQYPDPALAEKEVSFKVKINTIKEKNLPKLTDDFVAAETSFRTVEEFRNKIRESEEKRAHDEAENKLRDSIMEKLKTEIKFDLPPKMITEYSQQYANDVIGQAKREGVDITGQADFDKEAFDKRCTKEGESRAREYVILDKLARQENIKPDQEKVKKRMESFSEYMQANKPNASKEEWDNAIREISFSAFIDSVYSFLVSKVKIDDKHVTQAKK
ncbi:MAG: trigger factor [Nitrospinota bacterium]